MTGTVVTTAQDFRSRHVNISRFNPTQWDLEVTFGSIKAAEQSNDGGHIELHTGIQLSWSAAKALCVFLALNIGAFESENGAIRIPPAVLQADIQHLASVPVADMVSNALYVQAARLLDIQPPATELKQ